MTELEKTIKGHVQYYFEAEERPTRKSIVSDLRKDSQYEAFLRELAIDPEHPRAYRSFTTLAWPLVRNHLSSQTGWWAKSRGRGTEFVHQTWATPLEWEAVINYRIKQRDEDQEKLDLCVSLGRLRCQSDGWSFDPQYDVNGKLVSVRVWDYK